MEETQRPPETGRELRDLREQSGVTLYDIAPRLNKKVPYLSLLERDLAPMPEGFAGAFVRAVAEVARERATLAEAAEALVPAEVVAA